MACALCTESEPAVLEARDDTTFRILQLTDFHSDVSEFMNERTRADVRAMIAHFKPDLLAVTGDIWCGDDHPESAPMWMARDLVFLGGLGVPWAFTWGNHDWFDDFQAARVRIAATPNAIAPEGDGHGNFRIEVHPPGASRPAWDLFFLNSGPSWNLPGDLDWFHGECARIHEERGRVLPAIAYFHIPLRNYQDAIDTGRTIGFGTETVLFWGDDDGIAAPILKEPGNLRACFCGHSHKNDFYFVEDGITFAYGRATGYGGYGGEELAKGGKLLLLDLNTGAFCFQTVFADGSVWSP